MITPNPEVAELTRRARESWQSLRRGESWEHWLTIGRAIDAFRRQLFHDLKINEPKGQAYKEAMGAYLAENGWQQPTKEDPNGIDNTARVNLQKIIDRLPEFEAWRATLPLGNQLKQNHPNTVWRAFCKAFPEPGDRDDGEKRKTETQRLRQERDSARQERDDARGEIDRLTAEVETLSARAETATAEAGFMWDETPETVAGKMVKAHPDKAIKLAEAIIGSNGVLRTPQELRSDAEAVDPSEKFSEAFQRVVQLEAQSLARELVGFKSEYAKNLMLALRRLLEPKKTKKGRDEKVSDKQSEIATINASLDTSESQREA
jgi:hypothetical protein